MIQKTGYCRYVCANIRYYRLLLLALPLILLNGFTWGKAEPCAKAAKLLADSPAGATEQSVRQAIKLCPDGAAGHAAKGILLERSGSNEQAVGEYRAAMVQDPSLSLAHGNLGLLLLRQGLYDEAGTELAEALKGSSNPGYHRGVAWLLNEGKTSALLLVHAKEALKQEPDDPAVHSWLAHAYSRLGRYDQAEEEYAKVLGVKPGDETALLGLAGVYEKSNRIDDAIKALTGVEANGHVKREIHEKLAVLYRKKGDAQQADKEKALAGFNPLDTDSDTLVQQGDRQLLARNYDAAIAAYETVLMKLPQRADVLEKLGDAQMAAGRDDEAIISYRQALGTDSRSPSLHYSLAILLERKGLLKEAEEEYRNVLKFNPDHGDSRRRLADLSTLKGNYQEAIHEYRELLKAHRDNPLLHFKLAKAYEKNRQLADAITEYQAVLKRSPDNREAHGELAVLYLRRKMPVEAAEQYKELLKIKPDDQGVRRSLTALYVKLKKYDELHMLLKENVILFPKDPNSHYKLGLYYEFRKDDDNAITEYREAVALKADHARALSALGRFYIKKGDTEKARTVLEASRVAAPDFTEPRILLSGLRDDEPVVTTKHHRRAGKTRMKTRKPQKKVQKKIHRR